MTEFWLARRFGVSRRTFYHWIQTGQLDRDLNGALARYKVDRQSLESLIRIERSFKHGWRAFRCCSAQRLFEEVRGPATAAATPC